MKTKTSELTDAALDWAVSTALGYRPMKDALLQGTHLVGWWESAAYIDQRPNEWRRIPNYSTDWAQGGPIKARERISTLYDTGGRICCYVADHDYDPDENGFYKHIQFGDDELQAACRCFVASKLGDEVDVPEELL